MNHNRLAQVSHHAAHRATTARQMLHIGPCTVPMTAAAWSLSAILHGGLLAASYFVTWAPVPVSNPVVSYPEGDQATQIQILMVPWSDLDDEEAPSEETPDDTPASDRPNVTVSAERVDTVPPRVDTTPQKLLDAPATVSEEHDPLHTQEPEAIAALAETDATEESNADSTDAAEVMEVAEVAEAAEAPVPDSMPDGIADNATPNDDTPKVDTTNDTTIKAVDAMKAVEETVNYLVEQLERWVASRKASKPVDARHPPIPPTPEAPTAKPTDESSQTDASSAQTTGVETGVEMLDLPAPKYPSLSRRRGEEGVVVLRVEVLPDGSVGDITVLDNAGYARLTEAAIVAARKGQFKPATRDGHAVRGTVRIPFRFVLR